MLFLKENPQNFINLDLSKPGSASKTGYRDWYCFIFPLGPPRKWHVSYYVKLVLRLQRLVLIVTNLLWGLGHVKEWRFLDISTYITIAIFRRNESGDNCCPQVWGLHGGLVKDSIIHEPLGQWKRRLGNDFPVAQSHNPRQIISRFISSFHDHKKSSVLLSSAALPCPNFRPPLTTFPLPDQCKGRQIHLPWRWHL
jgi:hypothetical protein